jgi:hypothetical protein
MAKGAPGHNGIESWIRDQLARKGPQGKCVAFVLHHVSAKRTGIGAIERTEVPDKPDEGWSMQAAAWFLKTAEADATALEGTPGSKLQTYTLGALFEKSGDSPVVRHSFRVSVSDVEEGSGDPSVSEPATAEGLQGQLMRHLEAMARMATQGAQRTIDGLQKQVDQKDALLERYQRKDLERMELTEQLISRKHERELQTYEAEAKEKRKDALFDLLMPLVPMIGKRLTGVKLLPGGLKEGDGLKALLASITESQMEHLWKVLTPTQIAALASMMEELQKPQTNGTDKPEGQGDLQ